jgi:flagellar basal body rod protein FlgB
MVTAIAASGVSAAQLRVQASAHNLANLSTDGFRRQLAVQATERPMGVRASIGQATEPGAAAAADLAALLQAKMDFMASLAVFRTGDRMAGSLLDTVV